MYMNNGVGRKKRLGVWDKYCFLKRMVLFKLWYNLRDKFEFSEDGIMTKEELFAPIREKYNELRIELNGTDIDRIRELALEVHAMVHPAEISGKTEKTIASTNKAETTDNKIFVDFFIKTPLLVIVSQVL